MASSSSKGVKAIKLIIFALIRGLEVYEDYGMKYQQENVKWVKQQMN